MTKEMIRSVAYTLLISFYSEFSKQQEDDEMAEQQQISAYLQRAKLFIADNLTSSLSLPLLSNYLHITVRHLSRLFSEKLGQTFSHYVQEKRVQKSMELLLETDWPISRIAEETGGRFDYTTGAVKRIPVCVDLITYSVKVEADKIFIQI